MAYSTTILNQLLDYIPRYEFDKIVSTVDSNHYVKTFKTWNQFTVLLYAQAAAKDSLRDIQNGLAVQSGRLYHLGLPETIAKSTLADANKKRDYHVYEELFDALLKRCRSVTPKHKFKFKNPLYSFDSTTIDLCLESFPWAKYKSTKGAMKLHYQLDYNGNIPCFMVASDGKTGDISIAKSFFTIIPDSIYCEDRGYVDFEWFRHINDSKAFFVTRAKSNMVYDITGQQEVDEKKGVLLDATIKLTGVYTKQDYPDLLRLVRYYDKETGRVFEFITNNFKFAATTIAAIYKARWQIEAFFKWIKQNLKIKSFLGTSKNAVMTQVWVAMCYYLLLAYIKYQTKYALPLSYLHRLIQETLLADLGLIDLLNLNEKRLQRYKRNCQDPQLCFNF